MSNNGTLLEVNNLKKHFPIQKGILQRTVGHVKAVDGINLHIKEGETLGLVGESGCGKTTAGRTILRLLEPTEGEVFYKGKPVFQASSAEMRKLRREMQVIFQDPYGSLNPRMTVGDIVGEGIKIHGLMSESERKERVKELLERVGLDARYIHRYPHEFSGGQRQRVGIARALALNPSFIVCDEAVSALDVSVQAQIINLLIDLKEEFGLSYLFIAHDLSVVKHICDRIAVMYLGKLVEVADSEELFNNPLHPYTKALISAIPKETPKEEKERIILEGDVPSPIDPPSGCSFHPRCPSAYDPCDKYEPEMVEVETDHYVSCHETHEDFGMSVPVSDS